MAFSKPCCTALFFWPRGADFAASSMAAAIVLQSWAVTRASWSSVHGMPSARFMRFKLVISPSIVSESATSKPPEAFASCSCMLSVNSSSTVPIMAPFT